MLIVDRQPDTGDPTSDLGIGLFKEHINIGGGHASNGGEKGPLV